MSRIKVLIQDREKKKYSQIFNELWQAWRTKGEMPYYYFGKFLYRKKIVNPQDYLSAKEIDSITYSKKLHRPEYATLLRNKLSFSVFAERHEIEVPKLLSYNLGNYFYFGKNKIKINGLEALIEFFENVFEKTKEGSIFLKAIAEMGGVGCYLLKKENLKNDMQVYGNQLLERGFIHQQCVVQHPLINKIYASSINTLRLDTYIDKIGKIHILSAFMRFGAGGKVVDNASSGGFYVSVDINSGTLAKSGHQLMKYGGREYTAHPDTGFVFGGFHIPFFEEVKMLIIKTVALIPDRMIGWDVAISQNGPLIIEGNDNNSLFMSDIAYGGYLSHPLLSEILEEV